MKKGTEFVSGTALVVMILFVAARPGFSGNTRSSGSAAGPVVEASQYVGSDTCKTCHEDLYTKNFETTPHFKTTLKDGQSCMDREPITSPAAVMSARLFVSRISRARRRAPAA